VLNDQSGVYSDGNGQGSVAAARMLAITHIFSCLINGLLAILGVAFFRAEPFERPHVV
jgi:hypothetical protein